MTRCGSALKLAVLILSAMVLTGCKKAPIVTGPDYGATLPPGASALRKITDPAQLPDLAAAYQGRDANLTAALDRSIAWFAKSSSKQYFPLDVFTHEQAQASAFAFRQILLTAHSPQEFRDKIYQEFDAYISVGCDNKGTVLYTGYYSPIFNASKVQTAQYRYPLYKRPANLVADPITGETKGMKVNGAIQTYPTRAQIEQSRMLNGLELVWFRDPLDAYIVQVNGSAKLILTDNTISYVGYAGNNGHEYTSIGRLLVQEGKIDKNHLSLPTLRAYFLAHPEELASYTQKNDRFVFFQEYNPDAWPAGSLGVKVTPYRSLATDKTIFPRASVILTQTSVPVSGSESLRRFDQFMLDQDTGGAIRAAGRGDIYMGIGPDAEQLAGRQFAEGRLYYFFLKPERVAAWKAQFNTAARGAM